MKVAHAFVALLLVPTLANAQTPPAPEPSDASQDACLRDPRCNEHYQQARALSKGNHYEAALVEYRAVYRIQPTPWVLYNIARMLHKLGRSHEALTYYQSYLEANPPEQDQVAKARSYVEALKEELDKEPPPPPLDVTAQTDGSTGTGKAETQGANPLPPGAQLIATSGKDTSTKSSSARPLYKRWWLWTAVGAAAAGIAVGVAVGTTRTSVPEFKPFD